MAQDSSDVPPGARDELERYPLLEALRDRRSRRFSKGMSLDGPLAYESEVAPEPLSEDEVAVLAFAACGITGAALLDWSFAPGSGGNMMARTAGRTVGSADAAHAVSVFVIGDDGTWLARRPQDLPPETLAEVIDLTRAGAYTEAWRRMRIRVADGRAEPPTEPPFNIVPNRWALYHEGTTTFLPVTSFTFAAINALLELFREDSGFFVLDERRMYLPAGLRDFAESRGGHLDDDPADKKALPLAWAERLNAEIQAIEQGMVLQNLGLAAQAMGLSGFPHYAFHDEAWFEALGFRMESLPLTDFMAVPFPASLLLKVKGQDPTMTYPVGLERDGEVLLRSYAPPYFPSMEAAVHAVVEEKYGSDGIYGGGEPGVWRHRDAESGWRDPGRVGSATPPVTDEAVDAVVALTEYSWERYGRFPATYPPFHTLLAFQAGHIDPGFYDRHYREGSLGETHRRHDELWHPPS